MDLETDRIAARLVALGYIRPDLGVQRPFWDQHGVAVGVGFVVLVLYVALVVALGQETDRLRSDVDRDR